MVLTAQCTRNFKSKVGEFIRCENPVQLGDNITFFKIEDLHSCLCDDCWKNSPYYPEYQQQSDEIINRNIRQAIVNAKEQDAYLKTHKPGVYGYAHFARWIDGTKEVEPHYEYPPIDHTVGSPPVVTKSFENRSEAGEP